MPLRLRAGAERAALLGLQPRPRALRAVLAAALLAGGCAAPPASEPADSGPPLSPHERAMREDTKRFNDTVAAGCGTGAFVGFGIGVAVGVLTGGGRGALRGGLGGAVVGCAAGGIDGYLTARRERAGRDELRAMRATLTDVQSDNAYLRDFITASNSVAADGRERLARLQVQIRARQVSTADTEAALVRERANIDQMQARVEQARKMRDSYRDAGSRYKVGAANRVDLDRELDRMDRQIRTLEASIGDYTRALAVSKA